MKSSNFDQWKVAESTKIARSGWRARRRPVNPKCQQQREKCEGKQRELGNWPRNSPWSGQDTGTKWENKNLALKRSSLKLESFASSGNESAVNNKARKLELLGNLALT